MNEVAKIPENFDELASLVKSSFPNIKCLRCNSDEFYLSDRATSLIFGGYDAEDEKYPGFEVVTLACTTCGYIENHLKRVLMRALKPVMPDKSE